MTPLARFANRAVPRPRGFKPVDQMIVLATRPDPDAAAMAVSHVDPCPDAGAGSELVADD